MNNDELVRVFSVYDSMRDTHNSDPTIKQRVEVQLASGTATLYTMGANNPVIRIDIKEVIK